MCGIVGVLGNHEVAPLLVEALKRLEYRGYDSAGIATINEGRLDRRRAVGKLVNLSDLLVHDPLPGKSGIAQTRWATHGSVTVPNAHPHRSGNVAVVHNGIIENFRDIREEMAAKGLSFESQTDTESVVVLTRYFLDQGATPLEAVQKTVARLEGAFALCFIFDGEADLMIGARKGAPLAVGYGEGENFIGSDALALAPMTDRLSYLEDGDVVEVTRSSVSIYDRNNRPANREVQRINIDQTRIEKAGYKHFMAKEIAEQPVVLADAIKHYCTDSKLLLPDELDFSTLDRLTLVACGTASYACMTA
ncbi:MAG: glutamine--fructose-6-phosphate aminotransferase, partial [Paracoccaceae bacterium]|nr:glutamine--fructose-6-phosphate aminotransferase [Paracoccaceae bacterium]